MNFKRIIHKFITTLPLLLVAVFSCTQNASAITFPNGWVSSTNISTPYFRMLVGNSFTPWATQVLYEFRNSGYLVVSGLELKNTDNTQFLLPANSIYAIDVTTIGCSFRGYRPGTDYSWANFIGYDAQDYTDRTNIVLYFYNGNGGQAVSPNPFNLGISFSCAANGQLQVNSFVAFSPAAGGGSSSTVDYTQAIRDVQSAVEDLRLDFSSLETQIVALNTKLENQSQQQRTQYEQPRTEANNANNSAGSQGSSSSSDAAQTGSTLLSGVSALVSALNVSPASSCVIDMDLGIADFGEADLCHLSPPPAFQVISSLVVIGFAVPLALAAAHKMIELFRSFA